MGRLCAPPFLFFIIPRPPTSTLFPYTTLFRYAAVPGLLILLGVPFVNRVHTRVLGMPFLLAWIVGCVLLTSIVRSEEHTSELQSLRHLVCRLLLEKKNKK